VVPILGSRPDGDCPDPDNYNDSTTNTFHAYDAPATSVSAFASVMINDSVKDWLLYTPSLPNSIAVPIQSVNWSWSGTATYELDIYDLSNPADSGSNGTNTNSYPIWSHFCDLNWVAN
jgi:hypothetical protein